MKRKIKCEKRWSTIQYLELEITEEEYENKLYKICEKQILYVDYSQYEVKNKIIRRLNQKGWEMDLIIKCLNRLIK